MSTSTIKGHRKISHEQLRNWLDQLANQMTLIAPIDVHGVLLYRPVQKADQITWTDERPLMSVKEAFFPASEPLLIIEKYGQQIDLSETFPQGKQVIFGIRPCDARGLRILDSLFIMDDPPDPYYSLRRQNTALIGIACKDLGETCFCTSTGGAPDDPRDVDVMLTQREDGYALQVITEKGEALTAGLDLPETAAPPRQITDAPLYPVPNLNEWPGYFEHPVWDQTSERCLSCRICAYVCPTCRCFDVRDEALPGNGASKRYERLRCWDSCAREAYRRTAGGHIPRLEKGERLRNRAFCKFYYYPQQYGPIACTGCGRCIDACPVNIDIAEILQKMAEVVA